MMMKSKAPKRKGLDLEDKKEALMGFFLFWFMGFERQISLIRRTDSRIVALKVLQK